MSSSSSRTEDHPAVSDRVVVARVRRPHGLRGEVAVEVLTDVAERLAAGALVELEAAGGERRTVRIEAVRQAGTGLLVRLSGCADREDAEALRGATLQVAAGSVPPAPEGSFYYFELVDCVCEDRQRGELGRVVEVLEDGGGLLLRVAGEEHELLVPFVDAYLKRVDVAAGRIEVELPEGLVDVCASPS